MTYQTYLDIVLGRCRTLKFLSEETQVDAGEVELATYSALLELADGWDLDTFTVVNDAIATTTTGVRQYPLPGDFGRLPVPRQRHESGLFIATSSTGTPVPLIYRMADEFLRLRSTTNATPVWFTISENTYILLDPPPDSNSSVHYTIMGVYIKRLDALDGNDNILVSHPTALIAATLARLAIDKGAVQAQALVAEKNVQVSKLVNNSSRMRQAFRQIGTL